MDASWFMPFPEWTWGHDLKTGDVAAWAALIERVEAWRDEHRLPDGVIASWISEEA